MTHLIPTTGPSATEEYKLYIISELVFHLQDSFVEAGGISIHPEPNARSRRGHTEFLNHGVELQVPVEPCMVHHHWGGWRMRGGIKH